MFAPLNPIEHQHISDHGQNDHELLRTHVSPQAENSSEVKKCQSVSHILTVHATHLASAEEKPSHRTNGMTAGSNRMRGNEQRGPGFGELGKIQVSVGYFSNGYLYLTFAMVSLSLF